MLYTTMLLTSAILGFPALIEVLSPPQASMPVQLKDAAPRMKGAWFSGDGLFLLTDSDDQALQVWNTVNGTPTTTIRTPGVAFRGTDLAFCPKTANLVGIFSRSGLALWDFQKGQEVKSFNYTEYGRFALGVALDSDCNWMAGGNADDTITLWNTKSGRSKTLTGHSSTVFSVDFSAAGKLLASGSRDETVRIWDVEKGTMQRELTGFGGSVIFVSLLDKIDRMVALVQRPSKDFLKASYTIVVKKLSDGRTLNTYDGYRNLNVTGNGKYLAAINQDGRSLAIWSLVSGKKVHDVAAPETTTIIGATLVPGGRLFVVIQDSQGVSISKREAAIKEER